MATPSDVQAVWSALLVDALASSGVDHVVLSPGSRSTPLVVALLDEPRIRLHDVIDERAAAFVALGIARATGRPAALVCTSGSAVAHYHPAVAEAAASSLPLVVLSANRPFAFQRAGESQTIDQTKLFGDSVRFFADLGEPSGRAFDLRAARRVVAQAVAAASHPLPGPVHLDARFVKPLEPALVPDEAHAALARASRSRAVPTVHVPRAIASEATIATVADRIASATRPIVVVGPRRSRAIAAPLAELVATCAIPVFVDPASNLRFGPHARSFLGATDAIFRSPTVLRELAPDLVLQIGRAPVASGYAALCAERAPEVVALDATDFLDAFSLATEVVLGDEADALTRLVVRLRDRPSSIDRSFVDRLRALDAFAYRSADEISSGDPASEGAVARTLLRSMPDGSRLVLGNSLAIREVDDYVAPSERPIEVLSQRGASGIDGLVAGLVGAQLAAPKPSVLLVGDVSLLHDVGSFALLARATVATVVVVVDNAGGRIFEQLPVAPRFPAAMPHFVMSQGVDFVAVASAFGIASTSTSSIAELASVLSSAFATPRATLVHVRVPDHGADEQNRALFRAVDEAASRLP